MTHDFAEHTNPQELTGENPYACFNYLTVEKTVLYRAVISVFTEAKAEFRLHLRPSDVVHRLREDGLSVADEEVEESLDALVRWGNLQSYHDTAEVNTIADFHRRRMLYQLTAGGSAAQRAAQEFLEILERPVALEAAALSRIRDYLGELATLAADAEPDAGKVLTILRSISADAEQLTGHAQSFFRWLHEQTESRGTDLDTFLHYKERLIDYLRRFLAELAEQSGGIAARIEHLQPQIEGLLRRAAASEIEGAFAKDEDDRRSLLAASERRWQHRWNGLRHWFVGLGGRAQVTQLRLAAGGAIPRLLALAAQLHERRTTRSDRRADLAELAVWFAEAEDDRRAHQLWRAAFGLSPARHLRVNQETLDREDDQPTPGGASWLDAAPILIAPQLRKTGRQPTAAPSRRIVDRSADLAKLRRRLDAEEQRVADARRSLIQLGSCRLADVGRLEHEALMMLIELLDRASTRRASAVASAPVTATSDDGSLRIQVRWEAANIAATIQTPVGCLHMRDAWIAVQEQHT